MGLQFDWDDGKNRLNQKNHGIGFDDAKTVFVDLLARIFVDKDHSLNEEREIIIGHTIGNQLLLVCFAERRKVIRIISARQATKKERQDYEENVF